MKTASPELLDSLENNHSVKALPKLVAEWNMNRYFPAMADNVFTIGPDTFNEDNDGYDIEMFPIESIYEPLRPHKGINKARVNSSMVAPGYTNPRPARFYVGDYDDQYKYWTSPRASDGTGALVGCSPFVMYGSDPGSGFVSQDVDANKVVVKFENSWATPKNFSIDIRTGSTWVTVFTQANVTDTNWKRTGELAIYYHSGSNTWSQIEPTDLTGTKSLNGVRANVTALEGGVQEDGTITKYSKAETPSTLVNTTGFNSHCDVIEISARLERNLSADLISVEDNFDMGEVSNLYPIGTVTSNQASLTLWNGEGTYSEDNPSSPYNNLLEPNVEMRLSYVYYLSGVATEEVHQFTMYADGWDGQSAEEVTVPLNDYSKFFQQVKPRPAMWEGLTVPQIIFRVLDSIGFTNYRVTPNDAVTDFIIPVFWVDGEKNMWEILNELSNASQTAIYFNGDGVLQVKTRDAAMNDLASPDYYLRGKTDEDGLANISELDQTTEFEGNSVKVSYSTTRWSDYNNGQPVMQTVWQPEDTASVRSTKLVRSITNTNNGLLYISAGEVKYWPYSGVVHVNAETIRYEGLEFAYYTYVGATGTRKTAIVKSVEEKNKYNEMTPLEYRSRNALTGGIKMTKRGEFDTKAATHSISPANYQTRSIINGVRRIPSGGLTHYPTSSRVQLVAKAKTNSDLLLSGVGTINDTPYYFYGTRMRIAVHAGQTSQRAGLFFHNDGSAQENGYYLELCTTAKVNRNNRNELVLYNRKNGKWKLLTKGARLAVGLGIDYDIDFSFRVQTNGNHLIRVWVNGSLAMEVVVTGADRCAANGRFGMYVLGKTTANYEYLYAMVREEAVDPPDNFSFLDKKAGGYVSDLWNHRWVYRLRQKTRVVRRKSTKITYKANDKFFDEFGPYVHEIREFDVKFDPSPVLHSRLFSTNEWNSVPLEYHGNPFGAKFTIANTGRINAILNGEDTLTFPGSEDAIEQSLAVYGRPLVIDEAKEYEVKNELQIQKRGPIEVELASEWIQSETMAKAVGDWILKHMSYGNDELSVEIFGNPLIEVCDVVHVKFPRVLINDANGTISNRMEIDGKYFVTGVKNTWENGISTSLTLRKAPTP